MHFKKIGITKSDTHWATALDQLGCFWEEVSKPLENYSLVIVTNSFSEGIENYLTNGGAVIDTIGKLTKKVTGHSVRKSHCRSETVTFAGIKEQLDLFSTVKRVEGLLSTTYTVQKGALGFWGIPLKLLGDHRDMRKCFNLYSKRLPAEEVSKVSKGTISRLLHSHIKELHTPRDIPFIHKSFSPTGNSPLLFRIDSDWGSEENIKEIRKNTRDLGIHTSWFLHVEAHEEWLDMFRSFPGDEIALHCYRHITKPTTSDIDKALNKLNTIEIKPTGYSAPYGIHNRAVDQHLIKQGFTYGSDFSFVYDSLPLHLAPNLLQIPTYPLCMGSFNWGLHSDHDIHTFFSDYINRQLYLHEPIVLYDHPQKGNKKLMRRILQTALECGASPMAFENYAQFWINRNKSRETPQTIDLTLSNECTVPITVWTSTYHSFILQSGASCHSGKKGVEIRPPKTQISYRKLLRFSLRQIKNSFINRHFWRKKR